MLIFFFFLSISNFSFRHQFSHANDKMCSVFWVSLALVWMTLTVLISKTRLFDQSNRKWLDWFENPKNRSNSIGSTIKYEIIRRIVENSLPQITNPSPLNVPLVRGLSLLAIFTHLAPWSAPWFNKSYSFVPLHFKCLYIPFKVDLAPLFWV